MSNIFGIETGRLTPDGKVTPIPPLEFTFLSGDVDWETYGGKFVSEKLNNTEFDYWLVIDVINWWEATGEEDQPEFYVCVNAVSPQLNQAELEDNLLPQFGEGVDTSDPLIQVEALVDYGIYACLWQKFGDDIDELMDEAKNEAGQMEFMFGFYMDRPQNRIGSTGWDVIQGDLLAGLHRYQND